MEFKARFRQLREAAGKSYAEIASDFDKSEAAIRAWELGRSKPDADTLARLSKYFECTTDYLLGLSNFKTSDHAADLDEKFARAMVADASLGLSTETGLLDAALFVLRATANLNAFSRNSVAKSLRNILIMMGNAETRTVRLFADDLQAEPFMKASEGISNAHFDGVEAWREAVDKVAEIYMKRLEKYEAEHPDDGGTKYAYRRFDPAEIDAEDLAAYYGIALEDAPSNEASSDTPEE